MVRFQLAVLACVMSALVFVVGCQSGGAGSSASSAPRRAVVATGQGQTVVYLPTSDGGVERLASSDVPRCAQCEADAKQYFLTGELIPKCASCGAIRTPLVDYSRVGHQ
jgi:hypothetical protein